MPTLKQAYIHGIVYPPGHKKVDDAHRTVEHACNEFSGDKELEALARCLRGLPLCIEHDEAEVAGEITDACIAPDGGVMVRGVVRASNRAGVTALDGLLRNELRALSLGHEFSVNVPARKMRVQLVRNSEDLSVTRSCREVSLVKTPARGGCNIYRVVRASKNNQEAGGDEAGPYNIEEKVISGIYHCSENMESAPANDAQQAASPPPAENAPPPAAPSSSQQAANPAGLSEAEATAAMRAAAEAAAAQAPNLAPSAPSPLPPVDAAPMDVDPPATEAATAAAPQEGEAQQQQQQPNVSLPPASNEPSEQISEGAARAAEVAEKAFQRLTEMQKHMEESQKRNENLARELAETQKRLSEEGQQRQAREQELAAQRKAEQDRKNKAAEDRALESAQRLSGLLSEFDKNIKLPSAPAQAPESQADPTDRARFVGEVTDLAISQIQKLQKSQERNKSDMQNMKRSHAQINEKLANFGVGQTPTVGVMQASRNGIQTTNTLEQQQPDDEHSLKRCQLDLPGLLRENPLMNVDVCREYLENSHRGRVLASAQQTHDPHGRIETGLCLKDTNPNLYERVVRQVESTPFDREKFYAMADQFHEVDAFCQQQMREGGANVGSILPRSNVRPMGDYSNFHQSHRNRGFDTNPNGASLNRSGGGFPPSYQFTLSA